MSKSETRGIRWRLVTTALALAAVLGGVLVAAFRGHARDPIASLLDEANALDRRMLASRIDGLEYRPLESTTRSTSTGTQLPHLRLRTAAAALLERAAAADGVKERHAQALAHLFTGEADEAIRILREVTASPEASANAWNTLAAATLERAAVDHDPRESAYALAAANRALEIQPQMPSALFNRVLCLDMLGLEVSAREAARQYLAVDGDSAWSQEIRDRLRRLDSPSRADEWKKAVTELERASQRGDAKSIADIVQKFPQEARSWGEGEFLGRWSDAIVAGRADEARRWLTASRDVGRALVDTNGEGQLRAIVDHLDTSKAPGEIARTFQTYRNGRIALDRRKVTEAVPLLRDAERAFERDGSPIRLLATHYLSVALLDANHTADSEHALARLDAALEPQYFALRAQSDWHRANSLSRAGRLYEAHSAARKALEQFERLREETHRTRMQSSIASALARLGRIDEAWQMRSAALRSASRSGDGRALEVILNSAVRQAIREREWTIARVLLDAQLARGVSSPRLRVDALLWRAFVEARLQGGAADVQPALRAAEDIPDTNLREDAVADVRFAEAVTARTGNPARTLELLDDVIARLERNGSLDLSIAYLERARAHRALRQIDSASTDLVRAIEIVESQRADITRDDVRDAFFGSAEEAYEELIDLRLERRDAGGAFVAAERMRARVVLDRVLGRPAGATEILDAVAIQHALPEHVQVVHFSTLAQRTLIVGFDRRGWSASTVAVGRAEIERLREELVDAIARGNHRTAHTAGRKLYDVLLSQISPHADELLVIVPDETLAELPFSALVNAQGKFLIEETAITAAPSAVAFVREVQRRRGMNVQREAALIVGDPAFDQGLFPNLSRLTSAARETQLLKGTLPQTLAITGADATPRRFLQEALRGGIIHIAAHAVTNRSNPSSSFFVLAPDAGDSGLFYLRDITAEHFATTTLVVLAGCRTAAASQAPGSIRSLATAFIAAGSRNVLGSLWDVEDAAAAELSVRFYRHLLTEPRPAAALRLAQLEMLHSPEAGNRDIRAWSALQMYGTGI